VHTSISGCCVLDADCNDLSVCNGLETCIAGDCFAGTPPVCDDLDACNGTETCDDVSGCVEGQLTDRYTWAGVKCALDAVDAALESAPAVDIGNSRRKAYYLRLMLQIKKNWAYDVPLVTTKVKPKGVKKRLRSMAEKLDAGMRRSKVNPLVAGPIRDLIDEAIHRVDFFELGASKP
jgi:hypothetical protein